MCWPTVILSQWYSNVFICTNLYTNEDRWDLDEFCFIMNQQLVHFYASVSGVVQHEASTVWYNIWKLIEPNFERTTGNINVSIRISLLQVFIFIITGSNLHSAVFYRQRKKWSCWFRLGETYSNFSRSTIVPVYLLGNKKWRIWIQILLESKFQSQ
jgi:hypothetical protein